MALSFEIDDHLTKSLQSLDLKFAEWAKMLGDLDSGIRASIHRQARISTIGATTRIENAVLTDLEVDWVDTELETDGRPTAFIERRHVIEAKLSKDKKRSIEEVAGCREMLAVIHTQGRDLFPLTQSTVCGLHRELLKYYPPAEYHLGRYKTVPNTVVERDLFTGVERDVLKTSNPGPITESAMADLVDWYNHTLPEHPWPIAVACEFVFRFLACHPFQDGNGRLGRALFTLALLQGPRDHLNQVAPYLAVDRIIEQHRSEYYTVLARVSGGLSSLDPSTYRIDLFLNFMLKMLVKALDAIGVSRDRAQAIRDISPAATQILNCFREQPEQRLTPKQIGLETKIPTRTISRTLGTLVKAELIQRLGKGAGTRYKLTF